MFVCKTLKKHSSKPFLQCSASCGGGVQHRLIKCVNTKAETDEEVEEAQCDHEPKPESAQKCNLQECESAPFGEHFEIDIFI